MQQPGQAVASSPHLADVAATSYAALVVPAVTIVALGRSPVHSAIRAGGCWHRPSSPDTPSAPSTRRSSGWCAITAQSARWYTVPVAVA